MKKPFSPACERNRKDIIKQLQKVLAHSKSVLEIGSGSGQHAIWFAPRLPWLEWYTSDLASRNAGLKTWLSESPNGNLHLPIALDVCDLWPNFGHDAVFSANTTHIMPWTTVTQLFLSAAETLPVGGLLCLYGPFIYQLRDLARSNQVFDAELKHQDVHQGLRYFDALNRVAERACLWLVCDTALPANNRLLVWRKKTQTSSGKG